MAKIINAHAPTIMGITFALYFLYKKINKKMGRPIEITADIAIKTIENAETCI
jgi:hypothetical protein